MAAKSKNAEWLSLLEKADQAGQEAVKAATVTPIVVEDSLSGQSWFVADGLCGFAWVRFPGNTAFGRFCKAEGIARPGYPTGLNIWVKQFGQSVAKKEAYAQAFAAVLREAGVQAFAESRLD